MSKQKPQQALKVPPRTKQLAPQAAETTAQRYLEAATAPNTRRAYQGAIRHFERWGGRLPATEAEIRAYLLHYAEQLNPRTLALRLTALRHWHRYQGFADPTDAATIRKTLQGISRVHGRPKRQARALRQEHLERMALALAKRAELKAVRDLALLLVGFFGAFRRSELVAIQMGDLSWEPEGVVIQLPRSKTDPHGEGISKALPYGEGPLCPVTALRRWLEQAALTQGPVFRKVNRWGELADSALQAASVSLILRGIAELAGLEGQMDLSAHSLRRGLATGAHLAGASFAAIKRQGGWRHDGTVWGYIEEAERFRDNAASALLAKRREEKEKKG